VTAAPAISVRLQVTMGARVAGAGLVNPVANFVGPGDAGGPMTLVGGHYVLNLATDPAAYPGGGQLFQSLVEVSYDVAPTVVVGREDALLMSR
jgi:hypothetical protein